MAQRTIDEIKQGIIDRQPSKFPELSSSNAAEWSLWLDVVAYAIWLFEGIMIVFKKDIESKLSTKKPGSIAWLVEKAYEFQLDYDLTVDDKGILKYNMLDESAKIIKRVSAIESDGVISLKVAKIDSQGNLVPLSTDNGEFLQFQRYIDSVKYAGTNFNIVSLDADTIKYVVDVYFDPVYLEATIQSNLDTVCDEYRLGLDFNGVVYRSEYYEKILSAQGVVTAKITSFDGIHGGNTENIDIKRLLTSGYFNYDEASVFNLINNNE
jgi:hypothetical protein